MYFKSFLSFLLIASFLKSKADFKDSVRYYLNHKKPSLIGGLSSRKTFIGDHHTLVNGMSLGADYGEKISLLGGIYTLSQPLIIKKIIYPNLPNEYTVDEISRFWYFGFTGDYFFLKKNRWALDVPVRIGIGSANIEQRKPDKTKELILETSHFIVPVEAGISAQYKLTWWLGISAGLGSRIVIGQGMSQRYSGTYYTIGITTFYGSIYNHIREDMKKNPTHPHK